MFRKKFQQDLKQGHFYEKEALKYFEYDTYEQKEGYFKEYDFTYTKDDETFKVEVKSDRLASRTGNLFIEFECRNKPSGIGATTADYWVYFILFCKNNNVYGGEVIKTECYVIPTDELKKLIKRCRIVSGGDDYASKGYLLNKNKCSKYLKSPLQKD